MTFADQLRKLNACAVAINWVGDRTLAQAWRDCERTNWMLWLLHELKIDTRRCAGLFALRVWHLVPKDAKLAAAWAIDCALRGADEDERAAACASAAAACAFAAATAAASAADAAADASAAATAAAHACAAAADAYAAATAACSAVYDAERRAQCAIIRDEIPLPVVRAALNRRMRRE